MFARIDYKIVKNERKDKFDKNEFVGEQIVLIKDEGEVKNDRTGRDAAPKFLGAESDLDPSDDRLAEVAAWLTSPRNRRFAETQVNLVWYHLMGRGLVDPIDDFRITNPPSHPELMSALVDDFIEHQFDLRHLARRILLSETYQRSSLPNATNTEDQSNYSRAIVRRWSAEQLLDAQARVLGLPIEFAGYDDPIRAGQIRGVRRVRLRKKQATAGDRFLTTFGKSGRLLGCECERSNETNLKQAFEFVSGPLNRKLFDSKGRLAEMARSAKSNQELVTQLYWIALGRRPTAPEHSAMTDVLAKADDRAAALEDIAWALMNAKEFVFRH